MAANFAKLPAAIRVGRATRLSYRCPYDLANASRYRRIKSRSL
jgi:hypothetical protein